MPSLGGATGSLNSEPLGRAGLEDASAAAASVFLHGARAR